MIQDKIHEILINDWDPIGIKDLPEAQDEYDHYIPTIYKLLLLQRTKNEIFDYLWWLETEHMGLIADQQRTEKISIELLNTYKDFCKISGVSEESKKKHLMNIQSQLFSIIPAVENYLAPDDMNRLNEYLLHNEFGLVIEYICIQLIEYEANISSDLFKNIQSIGTSMEMDKKIWEGLTYQ